ncbi:hypothetical protein B0F90DRAFT_1919392 [Multifurca ochricompacta]|uniref:Hydrophobin n=1 Tax=Multifurca ochricompacta TaxID=376703 RepID=A0AAD4QKW9_9AGAM|nr:hypothetical protein B0F90DRAFT_1919392 [Multifurca ochricompacta]
MFLHKPLITMFAALAVASGVAASVTPVRRDDGASVPGSIPASKCTGTLQCCDQFTPIDNPSTTSTGTVGVTLGSISGTGNGCAGILSGHCNTNALCCGDVKQNGTVTVGISCIPVIVGA